MTTPLLRRQLYLDLFTLVRAKVPSTQHRTASTTSSIKRGLLATAPAPSRSQSPVQPRWQERASIPAVNRWEGRGSTKKRQQTLSHDVRNGGRPQREERVRRESVAPLIRSPSSKYNEDYRHHDAVERVRYGSGASDRHGESRAREQRVTRLARATSDSKSFTPQKQAFNPERPRTSGELEHKPSGILAKPARDTGIDHRLYELMPAIRKAELNMVDPHEIRPMIEEVKSLLSKINLQPNFREKRRDILEELDQRLGTHGLMTLGSRKPSSHLTKLWAHRLRPLTLITRDLGDGQDKTSSSHKRHTVGNEPDAARKSGDGRPNMPDKSLRKSDKSPRKSNPDTIEQRSAGMIDTAAAREHIIAPTDNTKSAAFHKLDSAEMSVDDGSNRPDEPLFEPELIKGTAIHDDDTALDVDAIPVAVPYTTAASLFLYGYNVVLAALRAKRRKVHHLYLHERISSHEPDAHELMLLAEQLGIPVTTNAHTRLLNRMAEERPHNGVVLEASRLPAPPVLAIGKPSQDPPGIPVQLDRQSAEDAAVNGAPSVIPCMAATSTWRKPLILMLDGITDPGNVGNIIRTAHFYGVDAVAVATNTCADLSSATLAKASSGACEAVQLLSIPKPANFVRDAAKAGWKVYAAVAPPVPGRTSARDVGRSLTTHAIAASSPLATQPCLLMLGSEGEGLRANLVNKADYLLSVEHGQKTSGTPDIGLDSLNVGVAAGVLMETFMRRPVEVERKTDGVVKKASKNVDKLPSAEGKAQSVDELLSGMRDL